MAIDYITGGQLSFPAEADAKALRTNIDSAGQTVILPGDPAVHAVAKGKLKAILDANATQKVTDAEVTDAVAAMLSYHRKAWSGPLGSAPGSSYPKQEMKTHLSLIHAMQPSEDDLKNAGLLPAIAQLIGNYAANTSKPALERGLDRLGLGAPMTQAELEQQAPGFIQSIKQGRGAGIP